MFHHARIPAGPQVKANNITKIHSSNLLSPPPQPLQLVASGGLLTALCSALKKCVAAQSSGISYSLPQNLQLALLLSAASSGVPASLPTQGLTIAGRNQVRSSCSRLVLLLDAIPTAFHLLMQARLCSRYDWHVCALQCNWFDVMMGPHTRVYAVVRLMLQGCSVCSQC